MFFTSIYVNVAEVVPYHVQNDKETEDILSYELNSRWVNWYQDEDEAREFATELMTMHGCG